LAIAALSGIAAGAASAATYTVSTNADSGAGSLRAAITSADGDPSPGRVIDFNSGLGTITLASELPAITNSVTINGSGTTLSGAGTYRGLFVYDGTVAISDLTITNTKARGGDGGLGGGGGGAGLGGGLFVASGGSVTVSNLAFTGNSAIGGNGGGGSALTLGGGGGLGGNGESGSQGSNGEAGGGGVGLTATGGSNGGPGGPGIILGAASGGNGNTGGAGGANGGGGGGAGVNDEGGGGGGVGGGPGNGAGGFGGFGGGGGAREGFGKGGNGGFGGGGANEAGNGGFGGGGGMTGGHGGFGGEGGAVAVGPGGGGGGMGGAVFVQQGGSLTLAGPLTISGGSVSGGNPGGSAFGSGIFMQNADAIFSPATGQSQSVADVIADQGDGSLTTVTKNGAGTLTLAGANAYAGGTTVNAGSLVFSGDTSGLSGGLSDESAVTFDQGADSSFKGAISGSGSLTKQGTGALTLSGSNSYGGGTTVSEGSLHGTTASLQRAILDSANVTFDQATSGTFDGSLSGSGSLTKQGTGTVNLLEPNAHAGGTAVTGGLLGFGSLAQLGSANVTLNGGGLQWETGTSTDVSPRLNALGANGGSFDTNGNEVTLASAISGSGALTKLGAGTLHLKAANSYAGGTLVEGGLLGFGSLANLGSEDVTLNGGGLQWETGTSTDVSPRLNALGSNGGKFDTNGNDVTLASAISGAGDLTKQGAGTLTLSGDNTYVGGNTVSAGTLRGTTSSLKGNILDDAAVTFDQTGDGIYDGTLSGSGSLTKRGPGAVILEANNTYAGGTTVEDGLLGFGSLAQLGSGNVTLNGGGLRWATDSSTDVSPRLNPLGANGGTFETNGNNVTLASPITGDGAVTKEGAGTLALTGNNGYAGGTNVNEGLVEFGSLANLGPGKVTLNGGGLRWKTGNTADVSPRLNALGSGGAILDTNANSVALASPISGSGGLTKTGGGTLNLAADNTYTGATDVQQGTMLVDGTVDGPITVRNGTTLVVSGTVNGQVTVDSGGTLACAGGTLGGGVVNSGGGLTGHPGKPTAVSATAGDGQAAVSFTPGSADCFPVTYVASAAPGLAQASGAGSPLTVPGLTNGTSYTFTVTAINPVGSSAPSAPSNAVIPGGTAPGIGGAPSPVPAAPITKPKHKCKKGKKAGKHGGKKRCGKKHKKKHT
jgi:autotransporter-associated beta strand protein